PSPAPAGLGATAAADTLCALRRDPLSGWSYSQKEHARHALEGSERIVSAAGPREALDAVGSFSCNLNQCKQGNRAHDLLKRLKEQVESCRYSLITELYSAERRLLIETIRRFDRVYRERKCRVGALDFSDL